MSEHNPVYLTVATLVREQIADGTLKPGQLAPSAEELRRSTGHGIIACRKALQALLASGALVRGPSQASRPRIAGDLHNAKLLGTSAARELSSGLADRRRAAGLTQPELAALLDASITSIGHAETAVSGRAGRSGNSPTRPSTRTGNCSPGMTPTSGHAPRPLS